MRNCKPWGRARHAGAALVVCLGLAPLGACDSVLGIEEPQSRPNDGGEAGAPASAAGTTSVQPSEGGAGGEAGEPGVVTFPGAGAAGDGGLGGSGGEPPMPECAQDETRCGGDADRAPQVCDAGGHWVPNTDEAEGDCPALCKAGKCVECEENETRCTACAEGDAECEPRQVQKCVGGAWVDDGNACAHYCDAGECRTPTSCNGAGIRAVCNSESCCQSLLVPGGTFKRDFDGGEYFSNDSFGAKLTSFHLDKYEVTVGRMRAFVEAFPALSLEDGDGKSGYIQEDEGWDTSYQLPASQAELVTELKCPDATWSDDIGTNDYLPINCVSFNVAYAFCIWDGGRLPTNAEWNYAAAGGDEQRVYPWGTTIDTSRASYDAVSELPPKVGSTPPGNGRWGNADLAGSVAEWALDYYHEVYEEGVCEDCLDATASAERVLRGGSYLSGTDGLFSAFRLMASPTEKVSYIGFRCARDLQ